jgi:hypothetical protein
MATTVFLCTFRCKYNHLTFFPSPSRCTHRIEKRKTKKQHYDTSYFTRKYFSKQRKCLIHKGIFRNSFNDENEGFHVVIIWLMEASRLAFLFYLTIVAVILTAVLIMSHFVYELKIFEMKIFLNFYSFIVWKIIQLRNGLIEWF